MAHVLLGLALLTYGAIVLQRDRSPAGRLYGLSYVAGCISLALWPPSNSAVLDALTHVPGLGRLLNDTFATLSVILQFAFISTLAGAWSPWRRRALAVYGVMLALLVPLWYAVHLSITRDFTPLFYQGYYARPPALLAWNLLVGLAISYTCSLSFMGYLRALGATRTRFTRATTTAAVVVYGVAAVYGVLVVAQLLADGLGFGPTGVLRYTGAIVIVCVVVTLGSTGAVVFGPAVGDYLRRWFSLSRKEAALAQLLKDNINANVLASDQRVYLVRPANRALVRAVDAHCRQHGLPAYQRKVAR